MPTSRSALGALFALALVAPAQAQDLAAGKALASEVCAACHGANGVSVADTIPNLAGQKAKYLEAQLKAFTAASRKNEMMQAVAGQLSADNVADVTAYFASLVGAGSGAESSKPLDNLIAANMAFPADFDTGYTYYMSINFEDRKQVRKYYANETALAAARAGTALPDGSALVVEVYAAKLDAAGQPVAGADGFFEADKLLAYTGMERRAGWGDGIPALLRNEDWNYALFGADKAAKSGVNQATCLACHKPHLADSFLFTLKELKQVAAK